MDRRMEGWMDKRINCQIDIQMDGRMDRQMDGMKARNTVFVWKKVGKVKKYQH